MGQETEVSVTPTSYCTESSRAHFSLNSQSEAGAREKAIGSMVSCGTLWVLGAQWAGDGISRVQELRVSFRSLGQQNPGLEWVGT